jgi:hypothetical protein
MMENSKKKFKLTEEEVVEVLVRREYEVEASGPDDAVKQILDGIVDPESSEIVYETMTPKTDDEHTIYETKSKLILYEQNI